MTDDNIFRLTMFGELEPEPVPDYTELEDCTDLQPEEEFERWCGGRGGWDNWIERMDD